MDKDLKLMLRMVLLMLFLFPTVTFVLCYRWDRITEHQIAQTDKLCSRSGTKDDVIKLLGKQHGESYDKNLWIYWTWSTVDPLKLGFDEHGKLVSVSF
mgnify:FL=1